jgi:antitoxin component of RelBE/YafQ-DinJ toxin-antitoxin module
MQILEIKVPDSKTRAVKDFLKEMGIAVKIKKESKKPNAETIAAMKELKAGNGQHFKSVDDLFNSI